MSLQRYGDLCERCHRSRVTHIIEARGYCCGCHVQQGHQPIDWHAGCLLAITGLPVADLERLSRRAQAPHVDLHPLRASALAAAEELQARGYIFHEEKQQWIWQPPSPSPTSSS